MHGLLCVKLPPDKKDKLEDLMSEEKQPIMVSLVLSQILSEKKHQYQDKKVKFIHEFCPICNFTFIKAGLTSFKRMISNIINNAVDALDGKEGKVELIFEGDGKEAKVIIQDNGKGMSQEIIDKIMSNTAVTSGKKGGHCIGFTQIQEALESSNGKIEINSKIGERTQIILIFPVIESPGWAAREVKLNKGDTVVILDDNSSIHSAWGSRLKKYTKDINIKYFSLGNEAIDFINNFVEKEKIFLLADFELLKQELNGIHVIEKTKIKRSILVTSHYTNLVVRDLAIKSGIKILPKLLASEVPILVNITCERDINIKKVKNIKSQTPSALREIDKNDAKITNNKASKSTFKKVDLVLIDDEELLVDSLVRIFEHKGKVVDKYYKPKSFLDNLSRYSKDTKICMDNDFRSNIDGVELAKQLHENGYTQLYLFTGNDFLKAIPDYLTVISKTDLDKLYKLVD